MPSQVTRCVIARGRGMASASPVFFRVVSEPLLRICNRVRARSGNVNRSPVQLCKGRALENTCADARMVNKRMLAVALRGLLCCRIQTEAITCAARLASYSLQRQRGARPCRGVPGTRLAAKAPRNTLRAPGTASYGRAAARAAAIALGKEQLHLPGVWLRLTRKRPVCACHRRAHLSQRHPASCTRQAGKPRRARNLPVTLLHPAMLDRHMCSGHRPQTDGRNAWQVRPGEQVPAFLELWQGRGNPRASQHSRGGTALTRTD
jgi:hypothetical protein